jgi:Fe-S-cluster-containing dehydrogenase component
MGGAKQPRPARCFVYTDEETLARAVAAGVVTPHDAQVLRDFAKQIGISLCCMACPHNKQHRTSPKPYMPKPTQTRRRDHGHRWPDCGHTTYRSRG